VYATRAFYEKALERSVKTLKSCLNETAALRLELDATRAELDDALRARDTLAFQLGQSSAEVRSDLQKAVLELAKTETDLECTRRELAHAAAIARRESDDHKKDIERLEKRNATRVEELEQTIRGLESEVFALNVRLDAVRAVFTKPQTSPKAFALSTESGDDAATREEKEGGFVAVKEAPSETSVISADLEISDREVVDGVVVERDASRDAGAKTSHPR
jgi:chromosome segregation ATPase